MKKADSEFYVYLMTFDDVLSGVYTCSLPQQVISSLPSPPAPSSLSVNETTVKLLIMNADLQATKQAIQSTNQTSQSQASNPTGTELQAMKERPSNNI